MNLDAVEFQRLTPALETPLARFFADFDAAGDTRWFHPHAFTPDEAHRLATYQGNDLYYAIVEAGQVVGYGMLRGWDEGFEVPSLGIALHPQARGNGLGRRFMLFLHQEAQARGARTIRLKVYPENFGAKRLYDSLGYHFESREHDQLVGIVSLARPDADMPETRPAPANPARDDQIRPGARNPLAAFVSAQSLLKRLRNAVARGERSAVAEARASSDREAAAARPRTRDVRHLAQIVDDNAFIYELYRVILQRRPDLSGYKHYRALLARGIPKTFIVHEIASSDEVRSRSIPLEGVWTPKPIAEILALDGASFVREAYRSLLWREADVAAVEHGCVALKSGTSRWGLLGEIARSREARMLPPVAEGIEELRGSVEWDAGLADEQTDLGAILAGPTQVFVERAYRTIFGKGPEPAALAEGMIALAAGMPRRVWLWRLLSSDEAARMESTPMVDEWRRALRTGSDPADQPPAVKD